MGNVGNGGKGGRKRKGNDGMIEGGKGRRGCVVRVKGMRGLSGCRDSYQCTRQEYHHQGGYQPNPPQPSIQLTEPPVLSHITNAESQARLRKASDIKVFAFTLPAIEHRIIRSIHPGYNSNKTNGLCGTQKGSGFKR